MPSNLVVVEEVSGASFLPRFGYTPADPKWIRLRVRDLVSFGEIKTAASGVIALRFADGSKARLERQSHATLDKLRDETPEGAIELQLHRGELRCQPAPQTHSARAFTVRTPVAAITAQGEHFTLQHDSKRDVTVVAIIAGSAAVEPRKGGAAVVLGEGQQVSISRSGIRSPHAAAPSATRTPRSPSRSRATSNPGRAEAHAACFVFARLMARSRTRSKHAAQALSPSTSAAAISRCPFASCRYRRSSESRRVVRCLPA